MQTSTKNLCYLTLIALLILWTDRANAVNHYWVGGTGNWDTTSTHWSLTSGGAGGASVPDTTDNAFFDANSGTGTVTITVNSNCADMDWTNSSILTLAGTKLINIYGSLTINPGAMTVSYTGNIYFKARTSGNKITSNGKILHSIFIFDGPGGDWTLQDSLTISKPNLQGIDLKNGTLNTNGKTVTIPGFSSDYSNIRTLNMGASVFNISNDWHPGNGNWNMQTSTGLTLNAGTSVINIAQTNYAFFYGGDQTYNTVNFISGSVYIYGNNTFNNLTITGANYTYYFGSNSTTTITGSLTIKGSCSGPAYATISSDNAGTRATINATGTVTMSFLKVQDLNATGNTPFMAASSIDLGNNNSGWTINGGGNQTLYWVGGTGNWSDYANHWSGTSGGTPGVGVCSAPNVEDDVIFDTNSFTAASQSVTINAAANCRNMTWADATNNPTLAAGTQILDIYGSLTLAVGAMTINYTGKITFKATSSGKSITSNGKALKSYLVFDGVGGVWTLQDDLNNATSLSAIDLKNGTLNTNGKTVTATAFSSDYSNARTLNLGTSIINLSGVYSSNGYRGNWYIPSPVTGLTLNGGNSIININLASAFNYSRFYGGNQNYGTINFNVGGEEIYDSNTYNNLNFASPGSAYTLLSSSTQTINNNLDAKGTAGNLITIQSGTAGTPATLSKSSGSFCGDYLNIKDITATGGAVYNAGANSNDGGGNTGWSFPGNCITSVDIIADGGLSLENIHPNPARDKFTIHNSQFTIERIEIYNVLGEVVQCTPPLLLKGVGGEADVSMLKAGIYFVKVIGENKTWTGKFIKE